jgi:small subunit ribosomal protein S19
MELDAFAKMLPSRERRALKRGFGPEQKNLLAKLTKDPAKYYKVQRREMVIISQMLGAKLGVHSGKDWTKVEITPEMLGHRLGEFVLTRKSVKHSAPGFGATRSSKFIPLK